MSGSIAVVYAVGHPVFGKFTATCQQQFGSVMELSENPVNLFFTELSPEQSGFGKQPNLLSLQDF